ncbi:Broad specificity phosphatase PhoE [Faunimonas pinastri]|uniref:Broad specificity phosphatase PhoE n=1 Tax=Faunimonas pinastri TaxID=1855383 RepID=A0A1H9M1V8_9HYPH|nr:Broad specificity phosphatase PhoE [Faunimonas pinastri]
MKRILCIRHGQSTFNAASAETGVDPLHFDAPLTELGHQQVRRAREAMRDIPVELVVTSPLTRALQTTHGIFDGHPSGPRYLVEALHRERLESSCDVGRSPAELAPEHPAFSLDHLPDVWWHAEGEPDERGICVEPLEALQARLAQFRIVLQGRPEQTIAVVGHGTFFFHLTGRWLDNCEILELRPEQWDVAAE